MSYAQRLEDIRRFYDILEVLERNVSGKRKLANCHGRMNWPERGVYFFFEPGEMRSTSGSGMRIVRIGTHALKAGSKTTLWNWLSQHQGIQKSGAGNHRGSVFRHHVGTALIDRDNWSGPAMENWETGRSAPKHIRLAEKPLERVVSQYNRSMPFLWVKINDEPGPNSHRGLIERNSIALLSNYNSLGQPIDPPSDQWLGSWAARKDIQRAGLWNVSHVSENYTPGFLDLIELYASQ